MSGWHRHRHRPGPTHQLDTTCEGWGLLTGHQRGPTPGRQRGLSHGHGHERRSSAVSCSSMLRSAWASRSLNMTLCSIAARPDGRRRRQNDDTGHAAAASTAGRIGSGRAGTATRGRRRWGCSPPRAPWRVTGRTAARAGRCLGESTAGTSGRWSDDLAELDELSLGVAGPAVGRLVLEQHPGVLVEPFASDAAAAAAAARVENAVVETASRMSIGWRTRLMTVSASSRSRVGEDISLTSCRTGTRSRCRCTSTRHGRRCRSPGSRRLERGSTAEAWRADMPADARRTAPAEVRQGQALPRHLPRRAGSDARRRNVLAAPHARGRRSKRQLGV